MDFKDILSTLSQLSEAQARKVSGRAYGGELQSDDTDDEDEDGKKKAPPKAKRGRGRPRKGADDTGHVPKHEVPKNLPSWMGGGKKAPKLEPKGKEQKKAVTKHTLKDWIEQVDSISINETLTPGQKPIPVVGKQGDTQSTGAGFLNITDQSPTGQMLQKALGDMAAKKQAQIVVPTAQQPMNPNTGMTGQQQVQEKWAGDAEVKSTGEYSGKSTSELKSMLSKLHKSGPHKRGSAEDKKMKQINFALRAKGGWKKGEGAASRQDVAEGNFRTNAERRKAVKSRDAKIIKLYLQDVPYREIASRLKIDLNTVRDVIADYEWIADTTGEYPWKHSVAEGDIPPNQVDMGAGLGAGRTDETFESKNKKGKVLEGTENRLKAAHHEGKSHAFNKQNYNCRYDDMEEARMYHEGFIEGLDECYGMRNEPIVGMEEDIPSTVPGMADQADTLDEMDIEEMDRGDWMRHQARKTPGDTFSAFGQKFNDRDVLENDSLAFESWNKQLNELLTEGSEKVEEGVNVSISQGQQGAPNSVSVNATDADAEKVLSFIKKAGLGIFGQESNSSAYGAPEDSASDETQHGDISVVGDNEGMLSMMKKLSGVAGDDYKDEEDGENEHEHDNGSVEVVATDSEACPQCGSEECSCDHEDSEEDQDVEEGMGPEEEDGLEEGSQDVAGMKQDGVSDDLSQTHRGGSGQDMNEGIDQSSLRKSVEFKLDNLESDRLDWEARNYVNRAREAFEEGDYEEALSYLEQAESIDHWSKTGGGDEDDWELEEGIEEDSDSSQASYEEEQEEQVAESLANAADDAFEADINFMTNVISGGLNKPKRDQTTTPHTAVKVTEQSDPLEDWRKLSGIE